jgi:ubiquitin carboxyl-terminal hydrolase 7
MKELVLPALLDEPKILDDYEHTWTVENWRSLGKKEHGPIFQAAGQPWYVW